MCVPTFTFFLLNVHVQLSVNAPKVIGIICRDYFNLYSHTGIENIVKYFYLQSTIVDFTKTLRR